MQKPDKNLITNNVVVTLTTIPSRLSFEGDQGIKLCIKSLVNQNAVNYEIHLNIPLYNKITQEEYIIPEWLLKFDRIQIFRTEDLGAPTKLIPTVQRITNPDTIIIVVDDDLVYHPDMILEHVKNQEKWSESIVGYDGMRSRDEKGNFSRYFNDTRDYYHTSNYRSCLVDVLQHYKSVSYKRRYFEEDFFNFVQDNYSWADDLLMAAYFSYKKRDRIATYNDMLDIKFKNLEEWMQRGGVESFPILRHTHHESLEGCNMLRNKKIDDNGSVLWKFIDNGYHYRRSYE